MGHPLRFRLFASCIVAVVAAVCFLVPAGPAEPANQPAPTAPVYHPDPNQLWNRLYRALFLRVGPDGRTYGQDRLEPLLWRESKNLLEERSNKRAVSLLEEFLKNKGEKRIDDPLKRALLQRDLWLVFNWLEGKHDNFAPPPLEAQAARAAQERLRHPLAAVIGRLALSPKQIRKLPDNYAAAVASGRFARRFDPGKPDRPYLPSDLFSADGPWVCVGRPDGPVAPQHYVSGENRFTNSVFLVFLRLPAGRASTLTYLKKLRSFSGPVAVGTSGGGRAVPNPKLPKLPDGAEFALVRRALLIDSSHRVAAAPLTESVQLRADRSGRPFHEWRLSRALLLAGRAGGLRALGAGESDFKTGFNAHAMDELETTSRGSSFPGGRRLVVRQNCVVCHEQPGLSSFNSLFFFRGGSLGDGARGASLSEATVSQLAGVAVKWRERQPDWTALRKLLAQ
jgi:hypothetical protein